jgi:hypothetical protein
MKKLVIMPGGFHPWHAGHTALYRAAEAAFPSADVFVAATADTATRPFPFNLKKMLAQAAGVPANRFIQVKSPFKAEEITQIYDPNDTQLIFVRSEKDSDQQPRAGGVKLNGGPAYLQPYKRTGLAPMSQHGYMAYLPVAQFGPGMTSATEIRAKWPEMTPNQKAGLIKTIYPSAANNAAATKKLIEIFDSVLEIKETVEEVETNSMFDTDSQQSLVSDLSGHMSHLITCIKNKNFAEAQQLVTTEITDLINRLADKDAAAEPVIVDNLSSDYIEEKSIGL